MNKPTEIMLHEAKLETPQESIADLMRKMLVALGEDPNREGLRKTPERFEKALKYLTSGYHQNLDSVLNGATFSVHYDEMVVVKDIEFFSLCEHHLLRPPLADSGAHDQPDRRRHRRESQPGGRGRDH